LKTPPAVTAEGAFVLPETAEASYFSKIILRVVVKFWLAIR
jgi:hypothetical protein